MMSGMDPAPRRSRPRHTGPRIPAAQLRRALAVPLFLQALACVRAEDAVALPDPRMEGPVSVEQALYRRRATRSFRDVPLSLQQVSQLLWAAGGSGVDGVSGATRTAPSAGGLYPVEIYLVAGEVEGLSPGVYRYDWRAHALRLVASGDRRQLLARAALGQSFIASAPASVVITAVTERTARRYGERGLERYVSMDAAHAAENVLLQAAALGLGSLTVGAFTDEQVRDVLGANEELPLYIMPVGTPAG